MSYLNQWQLTIFAAVPPQIERKIFYDKLKNVKTETLNDKLKLSQLQSK